MPTATVSVDRSSLRLSEVARHVVIPEGVTESLWDDVAAVCEELGDTFDVWQDGLGQVALGLREDGTFAATVGGVVLSIPRQVAKTFLVGRIVFALCILFPNLNAIWTAHRVSTANSAFRSVVGLASRPGAARYVEKILTGDELTIVFRNGSVLRYGARAQNFGRGETQVDVEVFDEAQILRADTLEDMVPAANQAKIPHGALLFFMGTPPRPKDDGEEFLQRRAEALAGKPEGVVLERGDMVYVECSADPECGRPGGPDLMDRAQIEKANPSHPKRTPWMSILRMRKNLKDDDSWRREALGIWDVSQIAPSAIDPFAWRDLAMPAPPTADGTRSYAVVFHRDGVSVSLSAALKHPHGVHLETIARKPLTEGTYWLVEFFTAERDGRQRHQDAAQIVVFGKAGSTGLVNELRTAGVSSKCLIIGTQDIAITSATMLRESVKRGEVTHLHDPEVLDASIVGSREHKTGTSGGWVLVPKTDEDDSTPAESAAMALWAAKTSKRRPGRKTRGRVMA